MTGLGQNLRFGLRQLRRNPGFTATVIVTLALAIGANTAIFSIVNALMLRSLPYSHPERIGTIFTQIRGATATDERHHISGEQWELLRDNVPALMSAVSGIRPTGVNLEADLHVEYIHAARISAHYLDVLTIHPIIGRNFTETEDVPNGPKVAVLSYNLWRNTFGSNSQIIGHSIHLKGEPLTVVGVLPEGVTTPLNADVYTAIHASSQGEGAGTNFDCITRLRDGATWQEADAQIKRAWLTRKDRYELFDSPGAKVSYYSVPLQKGQSAVLRPQALALMFAAGFILLIACANLAGLMLARMLRRTSEIATRLALGASRWQVQKQFWVETLMLALLGGATGVCFGYVALRGLLHLLPEHFLPVADVPLDLPVLGFAVAVSFVTSVLFGMLPASATHRFDLRGAISQRNASHASPVRFRQLLIAGEVALTVVLLAASGLLIRTLIHLETLPPGFNATGVMTARASLDNVRYHDAAAFRKLLDESTAAVARVPGVRYAAVGLSLPYERALNQGGVTLSEGKNAGQQVVTGMTYVTPDYFSALQIPLLSGRPFTDADGPDKQLVAIVNQTFVHKFFRGENPVGLHLHKDTLIVGVVADVAMAPGIDPVAPLTDEQMMYVPAAQMGGRMLSLAHMWFQPSWIVRTSRPVEGLTAQMQRALATADPDLPFSGFYRMSDLLAKTLATQRVEVALLATMAGLALLLSAIGIFGLVTNIVAHKTKEIGIRIALGSTIREAMMHIGVPGARAAAVGLVAGLGLCAGVLRVMRSVLYGVAVYDSPTMISVVAVLASVALIASSLPTLRIARIDPAKTLREE
jgi:putative ABC transport system permease protein